jgi:hypothetical protein
MLESIGINVRECLEIAQFVSFNRVVEGGEALFTKEIGLFWSVRIFRRHPLGDVDRAGHAVGTLFAGHTPLKWIG